MTTTLHIAMEDALLTVGPRGLREAAALAGQRPRCVAVDPARPSRVYCGTGAAGLWRSDDAGSTWSPVGPGIRHPHVSAVAVAREDTGRGFGVVYAGTEPSAVFRSSDGGDSWEELRGLLELPSAGSWSFPPRPETHHVRWIAPDPGSATRLFVAVEAGALVRTDDGGRTWRDREPGGPRDTHTLVVHRLDPERLYSAAGDGYFESEDGGRTWTQPMTGLRHRYVWGCAVAPDDPEVVVVSAAESAHAAHSAGAASSWIYRRSGDEPWVPVEAGLPEPRGATVASLVADPSEAGVLWAADNRGVFRSRDFGLGWEGVDLPWPERFRAQRVAGLAAAPAPRPGGHGAAVDLDGEAGPP